ncbi:MAG: penicillin-binding protein 2 [Methylococcaceae bacterium]|nr:penicillin-binding protein 2 [Methylococcaceae bacterium]MCI0667169.1 penicillin-binding protein 2 [Methylococcaceae bacterium]MCI0734149.1 penicillin-binding protein 2 [Methylococcaceae bacterium]
MINRRPLTVAYCERRRILLLGLLGAMVMLVGRAIDLQLVKTEFLQKKAEFQYISAVPMTAYRGKIVDRYGEPLAISAPVHSVWVDPQLFETTPHQRQKLAESLAIPVKQLDRLTSEESRRKRFVYLKRRISPGLQREVAEMDLPGVFFKREYKRYYPAGEVTSQLIGFTNIDDIGQEGIELAYQEQLRGKAGRRTVIRDGKRNAVYDVEKTQDPVPGRELALTIDQRLQYIAYRELKAAFIKHRARSASLVLLDVRNGDVLAMVNQPSFNPNSEKRLDREKYRNRAITDVFEPGSTMKPFAVACALENGTLRPDSVIDTSPGSFRVGRNLVRDIHDYGVLDVARILQKSSNVGVSKLALALSPDSFWECYNRLGFGQYPGTGFPGEAPGILRGVENLRPFEQATLSFGYGLSGSAVQLARAYSALANEGEMPQVRLVKQDHPAAEPVRVMSTETARTVREMLELVVSREGTALRASVPGYRISGKTGTVKKAGAGGYSSHRYLAVFAGLAPASSPRIVMVVIVDEPEAGDYYGGLVAAPVFSSVMDSVLRLLGIQPDQEQSMPLVRFDQDDTI